MEDIYAKDKEDLSGVSDALRGTMTTSNSREMEEKLAGKVIICDGLYTGKCGQILGIGSSRHSIKLLVDGIERYEPDYALLHVTEDNEQAVRLLLIHHQELQKARESNEWKDPKKEVPDFEVDVLCDVMHYGTQNYHYAVLKRQDVEDAEWFTSDDGSEIDAINWQVVSWKYIQPRYQSELDQPK